MAVGLVQVLMETDNSGTVEAVYNYGYGLISGTEVLGLGSEVLYYHYDGLGTVRQLTDSSEAVTVSYMYDSFGNLLASSGTSDNTYGFTGQQQFAEADNMVFLRARYYSPSIGRFLSRDPIGYKDGMNLYAYCKNDPVNFTDPSGLESYNECYAGCKKNLEECLFLGGAIRDKCLEVLGGMFNTCMKDCKTLPFPANAACMLGCNAGYGVGFSMCIDAYVAWQTGCAARAGWCIQACRDNCRL